MTAPDAITRAKGAPGPRKSGVNIPESQRSTVQLKLRVPKSIVNMLDALCAANVNPAAHWTRSDFVCALIDSETNRVARRKAQR